MMVKKMVLLQSLKIQSRATREADCFINNRWKIQILDTSALLLRVYSILHQSSAWNLVYAVQKNFSTIKIE